MSPVEGAPTEAALQYSAAVKRLSEASKCGRRWTKLELHDDTLSPCALRLAGVLRYLELYVPAGPREVRAGGDDAECRQIRALAEEHGWPLSSFSIYGVTPAATVLRLLKRAASRGWLLVEEQASASPTVLVLGSSIGWIAIAAAALLRRRTLGVELVSSRVEIARAQEIPMADYLEADASKIDPKLYANASLVWDSIGYGDTPVRAVCARTFLSEAPRHALLVTYDALPRDVEDKFTLLEVLRLPNSWTRAQRYYIYRSAAFASSTLEAPTFDDVSINAVAKAHRSARFDDDDQQQQPNDDDRSCFLRSLSNLLGTKHVLDFLEDR